MNSSMLSQTVQGAFLSAASNILAQAISSYKEDTPFTVQFAPVFKFALFSIISNPPNIIWQTFLEDRFPSTVTASTPRKEKPAPTRTSKSNILAKFALDQSFGAAVNTLMFVVYMAYANNGAASWAASWAAIKADLGDKFWPMIIDGYKFWPAVSLVSFLWVPVDKRVVFGCTVGMLWGVYLSLSMA